MVVIAYIRRKLVYNSVLQSTGYVRRDIEHNIMAEKSIIIRLVMIVVGPFSESYVTGFKQEQI